MFLGPPHLTLAFPPVSTKGVGARWGSALAERRGGVFAVHSRVLDELVVVGIVGLEAVAHVGTLLGGVGGARAGVFADGSVVAFGDGEVAVEGALTMMHCHCFCWSVCMAFLLEVLLIRMAGTTGNSYVN